MQTSSTVEVNYLAVCETCSLFPGWHLRHLESLRADSDQRVTLFDSGLAGVAACSSLPIWTCDHHFDIFGVQRWYTGALTLISVSAPVL